MWSILRKEKIADKNLGSLTFRFDIGIASVGWSVLGETRIVDLGVRAFDKPETANPWKIALNALKPSVAPRRQDLVCGATRT